MKLEPELHADSMTAAEASHRQASQIIREFVQRQREACEYDSILRGKVTGIREQIRSGDYASVDQVKARFTARRGASSHQGMPEKGERKAWAHPACAFPI
ncbi:antitoxin of toxin-antitoxin stability system [Microbulbifer hainanensis]|uniref:antitoxin of toxin-antitoxin stability system n=1 Tax=Microbulbifer hainanensis TaxID=2735675 RepID=UPI0018660FF6|nr:antitoxin of toxin-antitoxin stability system [Microbulbifer hainanensis]